ncbi:MAG TPA: type II toxin-antitoxin system RelE/ParE family toxin [Candidatus Angelobacter sp.]|nr:type II toxin-antitoxin system RelE/ParE family toxin [Candidatus Angelobacter sp.]
MAYKIKITDHALSDAHDYLLFIRKQKKHPEAARRWFRGLMSAIYSLETMPRRCAVIPEAEDFLYEYRQLIFHSHRIIFHIDEKRNAVIVLRVYHGSRERIRIEELGIPPY